MSFYSRTSRFRDIQTSIPGASMAPFFDPMFLHSVSLLWVACAKHFAQTRLKDLDKPSVSDGIG